MILLAVLITMSNLFAPSTINHVTPYAVAQSQPYTSNTTISSFSSYMQQTVVAPTHQVENLPSVEAEQIWSGENMPTAPEDYSLTRAMRTLTLVPNDSQHDVLIRVMAMTMPLLPSNVHYEMQSEAIGDTQAVLQFTHAMMQYSIIARGKISPRTLNAVMSLKKQYSANDDVEALYRIVPDGYSINDRTVNYTFRQSSHGKIIVVRNIPIKGFLLTKETLDLATADISLRDRNTIPKECIPQNFLKLAPNSLPSSVVQLECNSSQHHVILTVANTEYTISPFDDSAETRAAIIFLLSELRHSLTP